MSKTASVASPDFTYPLDVPYLAKLIERDQFLAADDVRDRFQLLCKVHLLLIAKRNMGINNYNHIVGGKCNEFYNIKELKAIRY